MQFLHSCKNGDFIHELIEHVMVWLRKKTDSHMTVNFFFHLFIESLLCIRLRLIFFFHETELSLSSSILKDLSSSFPGLLDFSLSVLFKSPKTYQMISHYSWIKLYLLPGISTRNILSGKRDASSRNKWTTEHTSWHSLPLKAFFLRLYFRVTYEWSCNATVVSVQHIICYPVLLVSCQSSSSVHQS